MTYYSLTKLLYNRGINEEMGNSIITADLPSSNETINKVITASLFEDYINCPTKCFLRVSLEKESEDSHSIWIKKQNASFQHNAIERLANKFDVKNIVVNPSVSKKSKDESWLLAIDWSIRAQDIETNLQAVEQQASKIPGSPAQFIPIRFVFSDKISRVDKLLIAFDAFVLSKTTGITTELGKIIYGKDQSILNVKTAELKNDAKKIINKISVLFSANTPPELSLNKHCSECEFQEQCYKAAAEKDDLSLLSGLSDNEKRKLNNKGIFTVTQLSYTFRPRRRSRRLADKPEKYHHSLKALAIRENKIHIVGTPILKISGTPVFLDVESIPERSFYYLIGMQINTAEGIIQHSLWANNEQEEKDIWIDFLKILSRIKNPILIHYGSFEKTFIKKMSNRYPETLNKRQEINVLEPSINLLSIIYAKIYYPIYTNTLKDTAKYLNFSWSDPVSSGLKSIIWRYQWETTQDYMLKEKLIRYNSEDCQALNIVLQNIIQVTKQDLTNNQDIIYAHSLKMNNPQAKWSKFKSPVAGLEELNKAAYWDYQRERVYARKRGKLKQEQKQHIPHYHTRMLK